MKPLLFAFVSGIFLFAAFGAFAQTPPQTPATSATVAAANSVSKLQYGWLGGGIGFGNGSFAGHNQLAFAFGRSKKEPLTLWELRYAGTGPLNLSSDGGGGYRGPGAGDISLLYGTTIPGKNGHFSYGVGVGYVGGELQSGDFKTVGISAEIHGFLSAHFIGIGSAILGLISERLIQSGFQGNLKNRLV